MFKRSHVYIFLAIVALAALVVVRVPEIGEYLPEHTHNSGELTGDTFVGQTFIASQNNLSSLGIIIATYSGRNNTHPVIFHLKESADSAEDLRTVQVNPKEFGDNQFHDFSFEPIANSKGKLFFFSLTSPESVMGDAIAVQVSNQDPYPSGVAYIRGSGRQAIDLAFRASYNVSAGVHIARSAKTAVITFITNWNNNPSYYLLWVWAIIPILLTALFSYWVIQSRSLPQTWMILLGIAIAAFIIRLFYARSLPITFDEGNYLYDGWTLLHGRLAGGDGYVKAPLVIAWISLWEALLGNSILAGRISSVIAGSVVIYPVYLLTRTLWNKKAGLLSAVLWALMGSAVVSTIYVHTQTVAIFFGVSGLGLLAYCLKNKAGNMKWLIASGAVIGLAVASRKSMLGIGLAVLLLLVALSGNNRLRIKHTFFVGIGFLVVLGLFFTFAYGVYGTEGIVEAIGINSASDGVSSIEESQVEQVRAYSLRGMTPFFRESLPLILLSLLGLGFSLKKKILWIIPLTAYWWAWSFFAEYEGEGFMRYGIPTIWWLFGIVLLIGIASPKVKSLKNGWGAALLGPVWVISLAFFYMNWIKFHANYISEFIPPLVILGGPGILGFVTSSTTISKRWVRNIFILIFIVVCVWAGSVSNFITYVFEHTGTFTQSAAKEAAQWAKDNIPAEEEIFTGAALIPYLSGHRVSLDIAHPRWYAYEFVRKNPKRLNTFLPPAEDMVNAFRNADWLLLEGQTGFSFLMEYSEIEKGIETDWERIHGIENGSNTMTFYKRKNATLLRSY
jgi:4-amino-4-deoxy-L-arabinose transferase-like glycosyltransferase